MTRILIVIAILMLVFTTACYAEDTAWKGTITGSSVNFRTAPDTSAKVNAVLDNGQAVTVIDSQKPWLKVQLEDGREGWVHQDYVTSQTSEYNRVRRSVEVVNRARGFMGTRYVYGGGSGSGFDCSGFTMYVYRQFGVQLPHNAAAQMGYGTPINRDELTPGDLVFFSTMGASNVNHVGIYIGDGQFIHASSGSGVVRISPLNEGYYDSRYRGGRRFIKPQPEDNAIAGNDETN